MLQYLQPCYIGSPFVAENAQKRLLIQVAWGLNHKYGHVIVYSNEGVEPEPSTHAEMNNAHFVPLYYIRFSVTATNEIEVDNIQCNHSDVEEWLPPTGRKKARKAVGRVVRYMIAYLCEFALAAGVECVSIPNVFALDHTSAAYGLLRYAEDHKFDEAGHIIDPEPNKSGINEALTYYNTIPGELGFHSVRCEPKYGWSGRDSRVWRFHPSKRGCSEMMKLAVTDNTVVPIPVVNAAMFVTVNKQLTSAVESNLDYPNLCPGELSPTVLAKYEVVTKWLRDRYMHHLAAVGYILLLRKTKTMWPFDSWALHSSVALSTIAESLRHWSQCLSEKDRKWIAESLFHYDDRVREERNKECGFDFDSLIYDADNFEAPPRQPSKVAAGKKQPSFELAEDIPF